MEDNNSLYGFLKSINKTNDIINKVIPFGQFNKVNAIVNNSFLLPYPIYDNLIFGSKKDYEIKLSKFILKSFYESDMKFVDLSNLSGSNEIFKSFESFSKNVEKINFFTTANHSKIIEYLSKSISFTLSENIESADEIILSLENANEYVELLNSDITYDKSQIVTFINRIFITLLDKKNIPSPTSIIFTIIIGILVNRLDSLFFVEENLPVEQKIINNYSTKNYFYGKSLNIDEIKIGENYISSVVKELKNNKDKRLKSIVSIPIGVEFTVLKKDKKWIYISILFNNKLHTGFIQANELYSLN